MNLKTTLALMVLAVAGGGLFWYGPALADRLGIAQKVPDAMGVPMPYYQSSLTNSLCSVTLQSTRLPSLCGERTRS